MMRRITLSLPSLVLVSSLLAQPAAAQTGRGALGGAAGGALIGGLAGGGRGAAIGAMVGAEPAHLLRVKVGGVTVVITGGTATAIIMAVAADGTASQTKIAVESYLL